MSNLIIELKHVSRKRDEKLEPKRPFVPGVIVSKNGSTRVEGRPDYVWVREFNAYESVYQALNRSVSPIAGSLVKIGRLENKPFERSIVGPWGGTAEYGTYTEEVGESLNSEPHGASHEYASESSYGSDVVRVFEPAAQWFKVASDGTSLTVAVRGGKYFYRGTRRSFSGGNLDLTSSVPSTSGHTRYTLVYLNTNTNGIAIVNGTATPGIPSYPDIPEAAIPMAYVQLTNGQTAITTATHITDARMLINSNDEVVSQFGDLADVNLTSPSAGDYARYDGGEWLNAGIASILTDLLTVDGDGSGLDADRLDGAELASLNIRTYTFSIPSPAVGGYPGMRVPQSWTVTRVDGYTVGPSSTADINIEKRSTPGSSGTDLLGSELVCDTDGEADTSPSVSSVSSGDWLWLDVSAVSSAPTYLVVSITATV